MESSIAFEFRVQGLGIGRGTQNHLHPKAYKSLIPNFFQHNSGPSGGSYVKGHRWRPM